MKKKVLSNLTLALIGSVLCACAKEQAVLNYSRPFSRAELKEDFISKGSAVYIDENGQVIKINDPDDPTVNVAKELKISDPVLSLYYSTEKGKTFAEEHKLSVTPSPLKASTGKITWSSSNPSIASVSEDGLVKAVSEGSAVITATSEAGLKASSEVFVNNTYVLLSQAAKSAAKILAKQKSSEFEAVDTIHVKEAYSNTVYKDGVVVELSKADQHLWASVDKAYFRIFSDDEEIKTSGGSVVPSNSAYVFYTTSDYLSYIFCNSDGKSNYMTLDQLSLVDQGKSQFEALGEILQSFFVAGSKIMTDQFKDILSQDLLDGGYNGAEYKGSFGEDSGEFAFTKTTSSGGIVSPADEEDMGIPAGTRVNIVDNFRYLFSDDFLKLKIIDETIEYDLNGSHYAENFHIAYTYEGRNVELFWPTVSNYSLVDSIFDL